MAPSKANGIRIGCYSAAWGDSGLSAPQLLKGGNMHYLAGDLLAEVTMSILAKKMRANPKRGYATDFVFMMAQNMKEIKRQGVKVCVNAGGTNPEACAEEVRKHAKKQGIELKVGVVLGDNLMPHTDSLRNEGTKEMFSGKAFPDKKVLTSCNAYFGAFPIAEALRQGCDVVITGRCVDSALVLGPLIYEYGWKPGDHDVLAAGTLAGHLVECGAQCTGGLFTDYESVNSYVDIGYPVVEVQRDGVFTVEKPPGTDGLISFGSVCEQMLYEIGDPGAYHVPDVACDFTQVKMEEIAKDVVKVSNVRGQPPTATYKVCATYDADYTWTRGVTIVGHDAEIKARRVGATFLTRWSKILKDAGQPDFTEKRIEVIGGGQFFRQKGGGWEVCLRTCVRHPSAAAIRLVDREWACAGTSFCQAQCGGTMSTPISRTNSAFLFLIPKAAYGIEARVVVDGITTPVPVPTNGGFVQSASVTTVAVPAQPPPRGMLARVPLLQLCWARSGDKANYANIGLIARRPEYMSVLRHQVTADRVKELFAHNCQGEVLRWDLPGTNSMNFLLKDSLGGGGTSSLHSDGLAKTYGQVLLSLQVDCPAEWAEHNRFDTPIHNKFRAPAARL